MIALPLVFDKPQELNDGMPRERLVQFKSGRKWISQVAYMQLLFVGCSMTVLEERAEQY